MPALRVQIAAPELFHPLLLEDAGDEYFDRKQSMRNLR
jgi:hypothetical protein